MDRVERIMLGLGEVEDEIFKRRQQDEERFKAIQKAKKARLSGGRPQAPSYVPSAGSLIAPLAKATPMTGETTRSLAADARKEAMQFAENEEAAQRLKLMLKKEGENSDAGNKQGSRKRPAEKPLDLSDEEPKDDIRLFEAGWKDRYYRAKFDVGADDVEFRRKVAWAYVEGLCWVLKYYYQGCVSWDWYFPYHYAPFASDFDTVSQFKPDFSRPTKPFKPLEQLMSVFPAASKQHLPLPWQKLMTDENSPIIDLYPIDFRIDLNGKKFAWQGVALLPFVDEVRLLKTLETVQDTLTEEEKARNTTGPNRIFIGRNHPAFDYFKELYSNNNGELKSMDIDPAFTYGVSGRITADETALAPDLPYPSPVNDKSCPDLPVNGAMMVIYEDPQYPEGFVFPAKRLENAKEIPRALRDYNDRRIMIAATAGHEDEDMTVEATEVDGGGRGGYSGGYNGAYRGGRGGGGGGYHQNPYAGQDRGPPRGGYDRGYGGAQARGFSNSAYGSQPPRGGYGVGGPRDSRDARGRGSIGQRLPWHY
ncbi:CCHC-type domain-containing protein [Trichostrongylus colubriformis]|uniref:CCHC-type domain-containing protein n=1 Tax=Trichostrongylus colubriformis TaxID=6319 RepID=A0AAN8IUZ9_TRICO